MPKSRAAMADVGEAFSNYGGRLTVASLATKTMDVASWGLQAGQWTLASEITSATVAEVL